MRDEKIYREVVSDSEGGIGRWPPAKYRHILCSLKVGSF